MVRGPHDQPEIWPPPGKWRLTSLPQARQTNLTVRRSGAECPTSCSNRGAAQNGHCRTGRSSRRSPAKSPNGAPGICEERVQRRVIAGRSKQVHRLDDLARKLDASQGGLVPA